MNATRCGSMVNMKTCSQCQGNTEYHCHFCQQDLCSYCKEKHVIDLYTKTHNVTIYREMFYSGYKQEVCENHSNQLYKKYCESCEIPLCLKCRSDPAHNIVHIRSAFKSKREHQSQIVQHFRSEILSFMRILLPGLQRDVEACKRMICRLNSRMIDKARRLKDLVGRYSKDWRLKLKKYQLLQIKRIQNYENKYEEYGIKPVQFLRFVKNSKLSMTKDMPACYLTKYFLLPLNGEVNMQDVITFLSEIQSIGKGKRKAINNRLLKLMPAIKSRNALVLNISGNISHFVLSYPNRIWVRSKNELFLVNTETGYTIQNGINLPDSTYPSGKHTINGENELMYIDADSNIIKLSKNGRKTTIRIFTDEWKPQCVYCCPSNGDLLVGMCRKENMSAFVYLTFSKIDDGEYMWSKESKVTRYHNAKHPTQTITFDETDYMMHESSKPNFITENNNGDVVVSCLDQFSDSGSIVVTEREGRHRFSYRGPISKQTLRPKGICTDLLSNILVCDKNMLVHIIDKDGQFLIYIKTRAEPCTLEFDLTSYILWVGNSEKGILDNIQYLSRQELQPSTELLLRNAMTTYPMFVLLDYVKVEGVCRCLHISCVNRDAWVSDIVSRSLVDTTSGKIMCKLTDLCDLSFTGHFSVNRSGELFYIDANFNIKKISIHKSRKKIIKTAESTWRPHCVYCSLYTEELLVAMRNICVDTVNDLAKVTRYDSTGQLKQTIQHNNINQDLYVFPRFITENNNGDVVVSDGNNGVVVTSREGTPRFSYKGTESDSSFDPWGICTDALSHIIVCDGNMKKVHIINSDGRFLSFLLTNPRWNIIPFSLSYDVNNHLLYVGSMDSNRLYVYRDITQYTSLTDYFQAFYNNTENETYASMILGRDIFNNIP